MRSRSHGFTLIEVLIVIAVLSFLAILVLTAVRGSKNKAYDNAIRNDVGQLRLLAEQAFDSNGASYKNWPSKVPAEDLLALQEDIDKNFGDVDPENYVVSLADSQARDFCVSAPLRNDPGKYYCVDQVGVFKIVSSPCENHQLPDIAPNECPSS